MTRSDRIFGLVVILAASAYIAGAFQIRTSFLADPVGSKTFPIMIGIAAIICGLVMIIKPDEDPEWPELSGLLKLGFATIVMIAYAYALMPFGFLLTTAIAAAVLAWMIEPRPLPAAIAGIGLSVGLFVVFKYMLGLGLKPLPNFLAG